MKSKNKTKPRGNFWFPQQRFTSSDSEQAALLSGRPKKAPYKSCLSMGMQHWPELQLRSNLKSREQLSLSIFSSELRKVISVAVAQRMQPHPHPKWSRSKEMWVRVDRRGNVSVEFPTKQAQPASSVSRSHWCKARSRAVHLWAQGSRQVSWVFP